MDKASIKRLLIDDVGVLELLRRMREEDDITDDDRVIMECLEEEAAAIQKWIHENGLDLD